MLILASKSPRRRDLLGLYTDKFKIEVSDVKEPEFSGGDVGEYVKSLATLKASAVAENHPQDVVIGADTVVAVGGRVLGKPESEDHAREMLRSMSGSFQQVYTGICIIRGNERICDAVETRLIFRELSDCDIEEYVATGECMDKAGAYGIQGGAKEFVAALAGDYFNVIGLPMKRLCEILEDIKTTHSEW